ncbi:hypothetical protein DFP72DRAFT_1079285 [Ephemerocybe angulata]|uniref:Uncharacterized protein n=1 Tax=Ephemerocybe angulata TaxID=980116 RepID=A0A8H6LX77_9AGAR|nr:hypothetical protein DFP72DRAFT_1079285 [Tulosesus angulatus]
MPTRIRGAPTSILAISSLRRTLGQSSHRFMYCGIRTLLELFMQLAFQTPISRSLGQAATDARTTMPAEGIRQHRAPGAYRRPGKLGGKAPCALHSKLPNENTGTCWGSYITIDNDNVSTARTLVSRSQPYATSLFQSQTRTSKPHEARNTVLNPSGEAEVFTVQAFDKLGIAFKRQCETVLQERLQSQAKRALDYPRCQSMRLHDTEVIDGDPEQAAVIDD